MVAIQLIFLLFGLLHAHADLAYLPEPRHQQYMTYAFLTEDQCSLLVRNGGKGWMAIGGSFALVEAPDLKTRPILSLFTSANAGYRFKKNHEAVLTETVDARLGLNIDFEFNDVLRLRVGWTHMSGHVSDDIEDRDLFGSNLGNEILHFRIIRDWNRTLRVGFTLRPVIGSEPKLKPIGANQFIEWFPSGASEGDRSAVPYLALGFEQYGTTKTELTTQAQMGYVIGHHMGSTNHRAVRLAIGYYNGIDPRLKYAQFKFRRSEFATLGAYFDF